MQRRVILGTIFFLSLLALVSGLWLYQSRSLVGRASAQQSSFSVENSYVFVSPLRAKADGQEKIRVTVFALNSQGLGAAAKQVTFSNEPSVQIESIQGLTDSFGKAVFDVASNTAGEHYLEVSIDGVNLPQKAHLSFY